MSASLTFPWQGSIALGPGQEWHSAPIPLRAGDVVRVRAEGTVRFYAGLLDAATYESLGARRRSMFPFVFGTDEMLFDRAYPVRADGTFYLVLRVGGWNRTAGSVQYTVSRTPPGPAPPPFAAAESTPGMPSPAAGAVVNLAGADAFLGRFGRARFVVVVLSVGSVVLFGVLSWIDVLTLQHDGLDAFDNALTAQAAVLGAFLAVIGGIVAAYTFFGPKAGSGNS